MKIAVMACLLLTSCVGDRLAYQETCPGGKVNIERRTVDTNVTGRVRNVTVRTDACLN